MPEKAATIRDTALRYYDEYKWFVIPADPENKTPYFGKNGYETFRYKERYGNTLPPREDVESWEQWNAPGVRIGVRTGAVSGIVVVDVDSQEAKDFIKEKYHPPCPMVQSPREGGGLHLYFRHPGFNVSPTVGLGGVSGLDIRGDGGIVIVPPSIDNKSGRAYEWRIPPEDLLLPELPDWLLELLQKRHEHKPSLDGTRLAAGIPEGQRDTELNRWAGWLRQKNVPEEWALNFIEQAAITCNPPFNKGEAKAKVKWAYTHYAPGEIITPILDIKSRKSSSEEDGVFTLSALMEEEFPPIKWIVPGLLPEGAMLFGGKPKMGKSWMALGFCMAVATGGKALGAFPCEEGDALYMALEDNKRRLNTRAKKLAKSSVLGKGNPERLSIRTRAKRLDQGLVQQIEEWLEAHPNARLVVIDTLGSVRPQSTDRRTLYEQDYEVGAALTRLAGEYAIAILIIHHLKKGDDQDPMDLISGSTGLTGGMDGALVLIRERSAADGVLKGWHRELEDDPEIALQKVDATEGWWKYMGNAEEYRISQERRQIIDVVSNADTPLGPKDVAEELGKSVNSVTQTLRRMLEDGQIDSVGWGKYVPGRSMVAPPSLNLSKNPCQNGKNSQSWDIDSDSSDRSDGGGGEREEFE